MLGRVLLDECAFLSFRFAPMLVAVRRVSSASRWCLCSWLSTNHSKWFERLSRLLTLYHAALPGAQASLDVLTSTTPTLTHPFVEEEAELMPQNLMRQGMQPCHVCSKRFWLHPSLTVCLCHWW